MKAYYYVAIGTWGRQPTPLQPEAVLDRLQQDFDSLDGIKAEQIREVRDWLASEEVKEEADLERWVKEWGPWVEELKEQVKFSEMLAKVKRSSEIDLNSIFPEWTLEILDWLLGIGPNEEAKGRWTNAVTVARWCKGC